MNDLPEAAGVAFTSVRTPAGFVWNITTRSADPVLIIDQIEMLQKQFEQKDWTYEESRRTGPGRPPKFEAPSQPMIETPEQREMRVATDEALGTVATACSSCGEPAQYKSGISAKTGKPWKALFCSSGERSHAKWL